MFTSIFTTNVGISSLQTSVFGGIVVGIVVAVLYNKFRNIKLPTVIGFFSGVRFIPIITFVSMLIIGMLFSMVWPLIGMGIYQFGSILGNTPYGFNSFIFGLFERALVPFGLHHAFYAPL
jgi:PTS system glucose-specific IIC component